MDGIARVDNVWGIVGKIVNRDGVKIGVRVCSGDTRGVIGGRPVIDYVRVENTVTELCKRKHEDAPRVCKDREDRAACVAKGVNCEELAAGC